MTRTTFTGAYTPISVGTGATVVASAIGDDGFQDLLPLGFTFNYLGTNYTTVGANTNGLVAFSGIINSWTNTDLVTTVAPNAMLAAWWDDMEDDATSDLLYQTQGVPGAQTFTLQWTAFPSYRVITAPAQRLNFQVILYEGTNVIEFRYGPVSAGNISTAESASIGIKGGAGGYGNIIDGVSGSSFLLNSFMSAATKWPTRHIRFTPGAPTPIPAGTYTVGVGQTYPTLNEAAADLNHRGVSGPVIFSMTDAAYNVTPAGGDNIFPVVFGPIAGTSFSNTVMFQPAGAPPTINYEGSNSGNIGFASSSTNITNTQEPIIAVSGTSYLSISGLNLTTTGNLLERGLLVMNNSATLGSQFNAYRNLSIALNRSNTATIAIEQRLAITPTSPTGTNSANVYLDLNISNTYSGILLTGNATFPDLNCGIGTSSPTIFNVIGAATANDIGNGANQTYGIRATNQSSASIFNNEVRNVTASAATTDGIFVETCSGTTQVYRNKVHDIRNSSTSSTTGVTGIRANVNGTGTHTLRVYNNFVYSINSSYTGAASTTRQIKGIYVQSAGSGTATSNIQVDNNTIAIDGSASPNISNTCFEIGTASGPIMSVRNNIMVNNTGAQTTAMHVCWASTSATSIGNTGSASNRNDFYITNATNGFVGRGNTTNYATLANWQAAMTGQDANSITTDPGLVNYSSDLHMTNPAMDGLASSIAWVTTDIDNDARGATPDMGGDEITVFAVDRGAINLVTPVAGNCYTASEPVSVRIRNLSSSAADFSATACTVTVNVTGAITATLSIIINNNSLNGGVPLAGGAYLTVPVGTLNMTTAGTYTFNASTSTSGDGNVANDAMPPTSISFLSGTATAVKPAVCDGDSSSIVLAGNSNAAIQWQQSTDNGVTWTNILSATSATYMSHPTDTTLYRAQICGVINSVPDTVVWSPIIAPATQGDTVCGLDTLHLGASGIGTTFNWYTAPTGGTPFYDDANLDTVLTGTTTYYVSMVTGGGVSSVGKFDNLSGGAQQSSTNYNIFDVFSPCTLVGAYAYPGAAGNIIAELRDAAGTLITTRTIAVTAADVNNRTYIPLNIPLTPGTGYRLAQGTGSVSMFRSDLGVTYPYTLPGVVSIHNSAAGTSFYYWFYNWQVLTGCEGPRTAVTATVNAAPAILAAVTASPICEDDTTSLTVSSANAGYAYTWTPSGSLSAATGDSVMAFPAVSTTYYVDAIDSAGCRTRDTIALAINHHPAGVFSAVDSLICIGDTSQLTLTPPNSYYLDTTDVVVPDLLTTPSVINVSGLGGALTANGVAQVCFDMAHTWDSDMNFTLVSPSGTQLDLCSGNGGSGDNFTGTCFDMAAAQNITAGAPPFTGSWIPEGAGGFGVFAGENPNGAWTLLMQDVASGDPGLLFNWSISFNVSPVTYTWTSNPPGFSASTPTVDVAPNVTTTYFLSLADSATGCDTVFAYTLNVNPPLSVAISGPSLVCPGATVNLTSTVSGGDGAYTYDWNGLATTSGLSVVVNSDTTFILNVLDGCSTPVGSDTIDIMVAQPIGVTVAGGGTVCAGANVTLTANATGGDGNYTYAWSNGLGGGNPVTFAATTTTTYTVSVTDGCFSTPTTGTSTVTVNPLAVAAFTFTNANLSYSFTNTSSNGTTYAWDFGDGGTSTAQNPTHAYATNGTFTVCLTTTNSCGSDTACQTLTVVSVDQPFGNGSVQLWPNPNMGKFNVRVDGLVGSTLSLELYNVNGQRVMAKNFGDVFDVLEETLEPQVSAGVYYLRVSDGVNAATLRFVVE